MALQRLRNFYIASLYNDREHVLEICDFFALMVRVWRRTGKLPIVRVYWPGETAISVVDEKAIMRQMQHSAHRDGVQIDILEEQVPP